MQNAILESLWPDRGGGITNGDFTSVLGSEWAQALPTHNWSMERLTSGGYNNQYRLRVRNEEEGRAPCYVRQQISDYAEYAGKRVSVIANVKSTKDGFHVGLMWTLGGENSLKWGSPNSGLGLSVWEHLSVTADIPEDITALYVFLINAGPENYHVYGYFDTVSLLVGETVGKIEIEHCHIFPAAEPEQILGASGYLADGEIYSIDNTIPLITRSYRYEGLPENTYIKMRNFQRYVAKGGVHSFYYTDIDGYRYTARMLPSFQDTELIAPGRYNTTMTLLLTDRGIA